MTGPCVENRPLSLTVHAGKVKTTFGINDFVQTKLVATQETKASKQTLRISGSAKAVGFKYVRTVKNISHQLI